MFSSCSKAMATTSSTQAGETSNGFAAVDHLVPNISDERTGTECGIWAGAGEGNSELVEAFEDSTVRVGIEEEGNSEPVEALEDSTIRVGGGEEENSELVETFDETVRVGGGEEEDSERIQRFLDDRIRLRVERECVVWENRKLLEAASTEAGGSEGSCEEIMSPGRKLCTETTTIMQLDIWTRLSVDLQEKVVLRASVSQLLQSRLLSKHWKQFVFSDRFWKQCSVKDSLMQFECLVLTFLDIGVLAEMFGYSLRVNKWVRFPQPSFLPREETDYVIAASHKGLLVLILRPVVAARSDAAATILATGAGQTNPASAGSIWIVNPVTKNWIKETSTVDDLTGWTRACWTVLSVDDALESYKIFQGHCQMSGIRMYESSSRTWTAFTQSQLPLDITFMGCNPVLDKNGILFMVAKMEFNDPYDRGSACLVGFDTKKGVWDDEPSVYPQLVSFVHEPVVQPQVVTCMGKVYTVSQRRVDNYNIRNSGLGLSASADAENFFLTEHTVDQHVLPRIEVSIWALDEDKDGVVRNAAGHNFLRIATLQTFLDRWLPHHSFFYHCVTYNNFICLAGSEQWKFFDVISRAWSYSPMHQEPEMDPRCQFVNIQSEYVPIAWHPSLAPV